LISNLQWIILVKAFVITTKDGLTDSSLLFPAYYVDLAYSTLVLGGLYWHQTSTEYQIKMIKEKQVYEEI
jgi:hypothetical protein